jgi:hypothetical protein
MFPMKTPTQGAAALETALLGGSAWLLKQSDLSVQGAEGPLGYVTNVRPKTDRGAEAGIPTTPVEREDFSWVAELRRIDPALQGKQLNPRMLSERPPSSVVAGRLTLRNGKVSTYAVMRFDGKARPLRFHPVSDERPISAYSQAIASWVMAELQVRSDSVAIVDRSFDSPASARTMKLRPQDGLVEIAILNVPDPIRPDQCLEGYYELFKSPPPAGRRQMPAVPRHDSAQVDWFVLHPRQAMGSNLLESVGLTRSPIVGLSESRGTAERLPCPMVTP